MSAVNESLSINRCIVLASRPRGAPTLENFRLEERPIPPLRDGEVLLRTLYLSLDPYMRGRMSEGPSYAAPVAVGDVMVGGTVCHVERSRNARFSPGDVVLAYTGWQAFAVSTGEGLTKLDPRIPRPSYALGVLGMPGLTAYVGLLDIGQPKAGETVVVAAATGAVGSVVGQIAKLKGCRTVGIAGGARKCRYAVDELGFDECLDHREPDLRERLRKACPYGIDVYFESVGGSVWDAVMPLLNVHARVPLCGLIAQYNAERPPEGPDRSQRLLANILVRRLKIQGFIIADHRDREPAFFADMLAWVQQGHIRYREDIVDGLENAPEAFIGLLEGRNFGKLLVRVAD